MTSIEEFNFELVKQYLIDKGGKVTNPELVKHFRHYLNDPVHKDTIRQKFKDFVNRLACVKEDNGTKYLILRNEYFEELHNSRRDLSLPSYSAVEEPDNCGGFMCQDQCAEYFSPPIGQTPQPPQWRHYSPDCPITANECPPLSPVGVSRIHSSPCLLVEDNCYEDVPPPLPQKKNSFGGSPKRPDMPLPPPRGRKNHGRRGSQVEERVRQFSVEKELEGNVTVKKESIQDVTVSPGTVKEKTQIINRMAESSGAPAKPALPSGSVGNAASKRRDGPGARAAADDDTTSVNTLDPRRREWLLRASQTDYHSLVRLLREDPDLYRFEDFTSGYTALHWAAKFGCAEIVKLVAGSYGLNPNVKSHGGYTPLHLAYMFNQHHIAELLRAYGADANVRDNSGRKPCQYLKGGVPQPVRATVVSGSKSIPQPSRSLEKDLGFMRMGSFNSRVKRTAAVLTNPFGVQKLKPWGSADSVADGAAPCMAPPKSMVKKKKSKKVIDFPSSSSMDSVKSRLSMTPKEESDSDSVYGFPS